MLDNAVGRKLTLKITITDEKESEWIYKAIKGNGLHGVKVIAITSDDLFSLPPPRYYIKEQDESTEEAIASHLNDGFSSVEEARKAAPSNTSSDDWQIIDMNGRVM